MRRKLVPSKPVNVILGAMPVSARAKLASRLERVDLPLMRVLFEAGANVDHVYFPRTCVLSLLGVAESGDMVETATIGREGAFGLVTGMYSGEAYPRCLVQLGGSADRISATDFKKEFERSFLVRRVVMSYVEALLIQVQQSVVCANLHPVEARLARWLLMMRDRADSNTLPFTQDFLAEILGVARTTVTVAARTLRSNNLINYQRGIVQIKDRDGLERSACECYGVVRDHFARLLPRG
jgi:CRP-like cAMP-binding protein